MDAPLQVLDVSMIEQITPLDKLVDFHFQFIDALFWLPQICEQYAFAITQNIHPGLRLVPSRNFFLVLNRSQHFNLITLLG